jgi:ATP-dependent Clp protease ATP-binding subunit ClpA
MESIHIYFGSDSDFDNAISGINYNSIGDLFNHISKKEITLTGAGTQIPDDTPFEIENLIMYTDDYGAISEWALLGFSNNVLKHNKVDVKNIWLNNPPKKIYEDILKTYSEEIISESKTTYQNISLDILKKVATEYNTVIIGQDSVIIKILSSLYSLKNPKRKKPVTILFLGDSGVGKTETAKYINSFLDGEMLRIQFSMQQTGAAYQYIFGAEHGENCLARELIRRESNIVLLDEFDKVQPSFYNAFYQMFDEGLFVDGNYSVDVERCVIICTTNYMSEEEAENKLGSPIYSRFSKVVKFNPISTPDKIKIAERNYNQIFSELEEEDKELIKSDKILQFFIENITKGYYKNMRMLKNDIEDAINFEILKAREVL